MSKSDDESVERATRVLNDIKVLRESDPFNRYWLARLKQKRDALQVKYNTEPANEATRQVIAALDELVNGMANDENSAQSILATQQRRQQADGPNPVQCAS